MYTSKWPCEPQFCERWRCIWRKNGQKRSYNSYLRVTFISKQSLPLVHKYILKNNFNSFGKMSYMSESRTRLSPGWSWTENGGFGTVDYDLGQNIVQKFSKIFQKLKSCCLTWVKVVRCRLLAGVGQETEVGWWSREDSCSNLIFLNALSAASK